MTFPSDAADINAYFTCFFACKSKIDIFVFRIVRSYGNFCFCPYACAVFVPSDFPLLFADSRNGIAVCAFSSVRFEFAVAERRFGKFCLFFLLSFGKRNIGNIDFAACVYAEVKEETED